VCIVTLSPVDSALDETPLGVNDILEIALFQLEGGVGANNNKISFILSIAVPTGVELVNQLNIPSSYEPSSGGPIAIVNSPLDKSGTPACENCVHF
jgi:hypothetical protein